MMPPTGVVAITLKTSMAVPRPRLGNLLPPDPLPPPTPSKAARIHTRLSFQLCMAADRRSGSSLASSVPLTPALHQQSRHCFDNSHFFTSGHPRWENVPITCVSLPCSQRAPPPPPSPRCSQLSSPNHDYFPSAAARATLDLSSAEVKSTQ